jgi:hypothetical protein
MTTMAGELSELRRKPMVWTSDAVKDLVMNLAVVAAIAVAGGFALHFVLNPVSTVLGYPHDVGGFWSCALVVLGFIAVVNLLRYALGVLDQSNEDHATLGLANLMVAIGVAAWVVTLVS